MSELIVWSEAMRAIEQARTIDEVKDIRDKAEALRLYTKQAGESLEVQNSIAEIKLRAERRAGEILAEIERVKPQDKPAYAGFIVHQPDDERKTYTDVLRENNFHYQTANNWQRIADLPEPVFEKHIAETKAQEGGELTTAGMLRVAKNHQGIKAVTSSNDNEWYTPSRYTDVAREVLGHIDLDPASCEAANLIIQADEYFAVEDNGLDQEWWGRVWLNPPYGNLCGEFIAKLVEEFEIGHVDEAIVLVNSNATETQWFAPMWDHVLCFTNHRINFHSPNGTKNGSTHGSVFIYLGSNEGRFAKLFRQFGYVVRRVSDDDQES